MFHFSKGAWWEVDLQTDVVVTEVIIYNREHAPERLSNSVVSVVDGNNMVVATYGIGDSTEIVVLNIPAEDFIPK